jgi:chromosome segregation ATPase
MPRPTIVPAAMKLYAPFEPKGRMFQQGEPWPGDAWSAEKDAPPDNADALAQANQDLAAAHDQIEQLERALASKDHDLAEMASQRDAAQAEVAAQKQAVLDAQAAQKAAEETAASVTAERDRATEALRQATAQQPSA